MWHHPPPSGLANRLAVLVFTLLLSCAAGVDAAQGLLPSGSSSSPTRPAGFPAIDTLIERTVKLTRQQSGAASSAEILKIPGLVLPTLHAGASRAERVFHQSASRAIRQAYTEDNDDPAVLLSLHDKLTHDPLLAGLRTNWAAILAAASERASLLESIRFPLRRLRQAYETARFDDTYGVYRNLDIGKCLRGVRKMRELLTTQTEALWITLSPIGQAPLKTFQTLCEQALQLELAEGSFPEELGTAAARAEVAKAYRRFAPSQQLLKISTPGGWHQGGETAELTASIGVELPSDQDGFRCAVLIVTLTKNRSAEAAAETTCCKVLKTTPIHCKELRQ